MSSVVVFNSRITEEGVSRREYMCTQKRIEQLQSVNPLVGNRIESYEIKKKTNKHATKNGFETWEISIVT